MLPRGRYCCLILLTAFGPGALLRAQEKPETSARAAQEAPPDTALQALVEQYLAAYAKKDLNAMMALWSSNSPELNPRRHELEKYFAENDKIAFAHVEIHPTSGRGEKVRLRVSAEISAAEAKTGKASTGPGKMERVFELVKERASWKVWREKDAFDDLAENLINAENEPSRTALMNEAKDLVTPSLQPALNKLGHTLLSQGDVPKARLSFQLMQQVAVEIGDQKGVALALESMGTLSYMQGEHQQALEYFTKCIQAAQSAGDKKLAARGLRGMGIAHEYLNDYPQALRDYGQSLEVAESLNERPLIAGLLSDIGIVKDLLGLSLIHI